MKMIRAIIRPERERAMIEALEGAGIDAFTKCDVLGRGRQGGLQAGESRYDELAKVQFMLVVEDEALATAVDCMSQASRTGQPGDGKIFVSEVQEAYTISSGEKHL